MEQNPYQDWRAIYLSIFEAERPRAGLFEWWFRLTTPPLPALGANLREWEDVRRTRMVSVLLLILIGLITFVFFIALVSGNHILLFSLGVALCTDSLALYLNKRGQTTTAGIIVVGILMITYILTQALNQGGLGLGDLPDFDLMVQVELVAVTLLPPWTVFVVGALDSLFIVLDLTFQPHAPDLARFLSADIFAAIGRPIFLQLLVAVIAFLWVRIATRAIRYADRAEVFAQMERMTADGDRDILQQTYSQIESIQVIAQQIRRMSEPESGWRFNVRLAEGALLAPIATALSTLSLRGQRLANEASELSQTKRQTADIVAALREATASGKPLQLPAATSGTSADAIIEALNEYLQKQSSSS